MVVGLGLMQDSGKYNVDRPDAVYQTYLDNLVIFVRWLLDHDWDVRLLIGDVVDRAVTQDLKALLKERSVVYEEGRVIDESVGSVEQLLSQLAATDIVVATRFHNLLLAMLLNKPVISISFHDKCVSLMKQMGLSEYCQDINTLNAEMLIEQFCRMEKSADTLRPMIKEKVEACRMALDDQYKLIFKSLR
jgi:polysaccharide pyruvyl transferase WcaK-like protein